MGGGRVTGRAAGSWGGLAVRLTQHSDDFNQQLAFAYELLLARRPRDSEIGVLSAQYETQLKRFSENREAAKQFLAGNPKVLAEIDKKVRAKVSAEAEVVEDKAEAAEAEA